VSVDASRYQYTSGGLVVSAARYQYTPGGLVVSIERTKGAAYPGGCHTISVYPGGAGLAKLKIV